MKTYWLTTLNWINSEVWDCNWIQITCLTCKQGISVVITMVHKVHKEMFPWGAIFSCSFINQFPVLAPIKGGRILISMHEENIEPPWYVIFLLWKLVSSNSSHSLVLQESQQVDSELFKKIVLHIAVKGTSLHSRIEIHIMGEMSSGCRVFTHVYFNFIELKKGDCRLYRSLKS